MSEGNRGLSPIACIKKSNFWQAAFVRPFTQSNKLWSPGLKALLSYAFGLLFVFAPISGLIDKNLSSPVPLAQMSSIEGYITDITISKRQGVGHFSVKTLSGQHQKFFAHHLAVKQLQIGQHVRVWSQRGFLLFNGFINRAREILIVDQRLDMIEYAKNLPWIQKRHQQLYWTEMAFLLLGVFLITRPWWKHRKLTPQKQRTIGEQ